MVRRANKAEQQLRIQEILRILMAGGGRQHCLQFARQEWNLGERQTDKLLALARAEIVNDWQLEREQVLAQLLSQLSEIQQTAIRRNQLQVAINAIEKMAKLCRLYD
ncbi:MAG: hypothetical protein ACKO5F_05165 [Synechococcus sp.]